MTMMNGKTGGMSSEINVTPMIDVLLVLLIIFMVIVPELPKGMSAQIPSPKVRQNSVNPETIVLEVLQDNKGQSEFRINQQPIAKKDLSVRLTAIFANRAERVLFLKGDDRLSFTQVADVMDISRAAGVDHIGLMTPKVLAGQ